MSLTPVKRSHSVCAQGGINCVNDLTRQQGDNEWMHFDDTVYGGDFLQHQPPVKEMAVLGAADHRPDGPPGRPVQPHAGRLPRPAPLRRHALQADRLRRRDDRPAAALRARRAGPPLARGRARSTMYEGWDFLGPIIDDDGRCRGAIAQNLITMEIRAFPADAVVAGQRRLRADLRPQHDVDGLQRQPPSAACAQAGAQYANGEFIQVHPTAIPGADKLRLMSESARGEGGRVWVPRKPQDPRDPQEHSRERSGTTSSKSGIRSTATSCRATSPPARSSTSASTRA